MALAALQGLIFPAMNGALTRLVGPSEQGALQGGIGAMASLSVIIGPLLFTQVLAAGTVRGFPGAPWLVAAAMVLAGLAIVLFSVLPILRREAMNRS